MDKVVNNPIFQALKCGKSKKGEKSKLEENSKKVYIIIRNKCQKMVYDKKRHFLMKELKI